MNRLADSRYEESQRKCFLLEYFMSKGQFVVLKGQWSIQCKFRTPHKMHSIQTGNVS